MSIENRLKEIESNINRATHRRLKSLSDEELERIARHGNDSGRYTEWLKTLTDDEIEIIAEGSSGANTLRNKFDEYQKQTQKN